MIRQSDKKIYLYGRLSHEDELAGDSNSIINQRKILTKYAEDNSFTPYEFIYDDGFSGADFERPSFSKMIEDVEAGNVSTIIVKDMSRFGRDYLKVGFFTEVLFSEKDVRLIAINDNIDTERGENDFAPMMNIFNEWHSQTTSEKIRAVLANDAKSGKYRTTYAPYGFRKDPDDKHKLVIDPYAAEVIRWIYEMRLQKLSYGAIVQTLNAKGILSPSAYSVEVNGKATTVPSRQGK